MNNDIAMIHLINRLEQIESNTRQPVSWVWALIVAMSINFAAVPYIKSEKTPYLYDYLLLALDYEYQFAVDMGVYIADQTTGTDRVAPKALGINIIGMTANETRAYIKEIHRTESGGGNYQANNQYCYKGAGQFGASALAQVGLIKASAIKGQPKCVLNGRCQCDFLHNPVNWVIKGGHRTFMANKKMQDLALVKLTNFNIKQGFKMRVLKSNSSLSKVAGFAKAAHLKGVGAAKRWYKYGKDSQDGNGTKASKYASDGERLFD